jgi:hypothetical protein
MAKRRRTDTYRRYRSRHLRPLAVFLPLPSGHQRGRAGSGRPSGDPRRARRRPRRAATARKAGRTPPDRRNTAASALPAGAASGAEGGYRLPCCIGARPTGAPSSAPSTPQRQAHGWSPYRSMDLRMVLPARACAAPVAAHGPGDGRMRGGHGQDRSRCAARKGFVRNGARGRSLGFLTRCLKPAVRVSKVDVDKVMPLTPWKWAPPCHLYVARASEMLRRPTGVER